MLKRHSKKTLNEFVKIMCLQYIRIQPANLHQEISKSSKFFQINQFCSSTTTTFILNLFENYSRLLKHPVHNL